MNNFYFSPAAWEYNKTRLTNQIFKLLPLYEDEGDWEKQQESIILELQGYNDMFEEVPKFMILVSKLYALSHADSQAAFRKLVFEAIAYLKEVEL